MSRKEKAFVLPTVALLGIGMLGYFLASLFDGYSCEWGLSSLRSILSSLRFDQYPLLVALSLAVGWLIYRLMGFLCRAGRKSRIFRRSLALLLAVWNIVLCGALAVFFINTEDRTPIYKGGEVSWYVSRTEEIRNLRSRSVLFGRGEHYYTYAEVNPYDPTQVNDEILEVMDLEQTKAHHAFGTWYSESLLIVLSYCVGSWYAIVYILISVFWLAGAAVGLTCVPGIGRKLLYASCAGLVGIQVLMPVLDYCTVATWTLPVIFSTADWTAMIPVAMIQLTVMAFLVLESNRSHTRAAEPVQAAE